MLGPGTCPWRGGPFPRYLAESGPDSWWPQSFWAVTGDQIFSPSLHQEGTPCRSASCRGEFLDHCGQLPCESRGKGGVPGAHPALPSQVMSWPPATLDPLDASGHSDSRWQDRGDPGGKERGEVGRGDQSVYLLHKLPGVAGAGQQHGSRDTFSGLALAACDKPISNMAACLIQHSGWCSQRGPAGWSFVQGRVLLHVLLLMSVKDHRAQCSFYKLLLGILKQISKLSYFLILKDCLPFCLLSISVSICICFYRAFPICLCCS